LFKGCYTNDLPNTTDTAFTVNMGDVNSQQECIKKAKEQKFDYAGILSGKECWGGN